MFGEGLMTGQHILVTGGATGLGHGMASAFLRLGADITVCGRRGAVVEAAASAWRAQYPDRRIEGHAVDLRDAAAVEAMADAIWRARPLTGLVNNAAGNFVARTEDLSSRAFDAVANTVFRGTFLMTNAVGKRWIGQARDGSWRTGDPLRSVLSIVTSWVRNGSPFVVPSAMSKAGVDVMTKSLAAEWARHGIRLNTVGPGEIPTEGMTKRLNPGGKSGGMTALSRRVPAGRLGRVEELANLAVFLMTPGMCDYLTGESIVMDGANGLATGANFLDLLDWTDEDWRAARAAAST